MEGNEKETIKKVIHEAYIQGIHGSQDEKLIRKGFHEDFAMLVLADNQMEKVTIDGWLSRIEKMKQENPDLWAAETRYTVKFIDQTEYSAMAKLSVYKGDVHFSFDYMLLYKFEEGWRIVSKIFSIPK